MKTFNDAINEKVNSMPDDVNEWESKAVMALDKILAPKSYAGRRTNAGDLELVYTFGNKSTLSKGDITRLNAQPFKMIQIGFSSKKIIITL